MKYCTHYSENSQEIHFLFLPLTAFLWNAQDFISLLIPFSASFVFRRQDISYILLLFRKFCLGHTLFLSARCYKFSDFDLIHIGHLLSRHKLTGNRRKWQEPAVEFYWFYHQVSLNSSLYSASSLIKTNPTEMASNKKPANFLKKSPALIAITWIYNAVRKVNPPKITPAELGIMRIQSFFGSLVHP